MVSARDTGGEYRYSFESCQILRGYWWVVKVDKSSGRTRRIQRYSTKREATKHADELNRKHMEGWKQ
jgi:hypothetical protein